MARIVGVDLPRNKRGYIGLTYIYGVGRSTALTILEKANVDPELKVQEWSDDQIAAIRNTIAEEGFKVEGELRSAEHQATDGHRLLPRHPPPYRSSGPRSEHEEQCPYAQGSQEDRCQQEKSNEVIIESYGKENRNS